MVGSFADAPAVVEYERSVREPEASAGTMEKTVVYSTGRGLVRVISKFEYVTHVKGHRREWSLFLVGALLLVSLPYVRYRQLKGQVARMSLTGGGGNGHGNGGMRGGVVSAGRGQHPQQQHQQPSGAPRKDKKK